MDSLFQVTYDAPQRIWSGAKARAMYDFDCSIGRIVYNALRNYPRSTCQICVEDGKTATKQEIFNWSVRLAQNFKQRGLNHEDVICIVAKNSTYVTPAAVACLFNATPFHGVNPTLDINTLTHIMGLTKPKIIFCDAEDYEKLRDASAAWKPELITVTGKVEGVKYIEDLLLPTSTEMFYQPQPLAVGGEQTMVILCSSGTTGHPKAVCIANYMLMFSNPMFTSDTVVYSGAGLDWYTGVMNFMYCVADGCTRVIPDKPFTAENFLELVEKYKINAVSFSPIQSSALVACAKATPERLASIFFLSIHGGWIPPATLQKLQNLIKNGFVMFTYGGTEFGAVAGGLYNEKLGNSSGKLLPGFRARVVDENGSNLPTGEVGEIYLNHGRKWTGYYGNPVETQRMFDSQGWFHTGDVGYFDEQCNLFIVDRKKEIYKCFGMHYWTNDIEMAIAELPDVLEVCVVGIYEEKYGDAPTAMVVKKPGSSLSEDGIKKHVAERLIVEYKHLHGGVYFTDQLPHNANGKVLRRAVKEKLTKQ